MKNFIIVVSFFFFSSCLEGQPKKMNWDTTGGDVFTDGGGGDVFWGEDTADETMGVEIEWGESPPIPPPKKRIATIVVRRPACEPVDCDDANVCTDDTCNPATGCVFTPNTQPCDDGNACTAGDICNDGQCTGTAVECDDEDPCTADSCFPAMGCGHKPLPGCGEEIAVDLCKEADCDDGNACTDDTCNPATGCVYANNTQPCDDGNACTAGDTCVDGQCTGTVVDCDDGNACTDDTCNPATGCVYANNTQPCDDGNAYTDDTCNPATGCVYTPIVVPCEPMIGVEFTGLQLWEVKSFSITAGIQSEAVPIATDPCCEEGHAVDVYIVPPFEKLEAIGYLLPEEIDCQKFFKCRHVCGFEGGKYWLPIVQYTPPTECACWNDVPAWGPDGPIYE